MVSIELLVQQVVNGLLFGGQLALMAVGLTLIRGVARVLNFGHGAMCSWSADLWATSPLGATGNIVVAVVSAALVVFALGYLTEVALIRPLRDREEFGIPSMVVTLGLAFFLENAFIVWIGSQRESFPRFTSVVWDIGGITLSAHSGC